MIRPFSCISRAGNVFTRTLNYFGQLDPTCAACGIGEESAKSAFHFICVCTTLANLRTQIFGKPILSVSEYEEMSAGSFVQFAEKSGRFVPDVFLYYYSFSIFLQG
jgi:hypothetical protein